MTATQQAPATVVFQGIEVPAASVNAKAFFAGTRRLRSPLATLSSFAGFGATDTITMRKAGVLAAVELKLVGSLVVTPGTGSVATTYRWPYDIGRVKFTANGQSNLIACKGWVLKARDIFRRGDLSDRGVSRGIGGASPGTATTQGTLSLASESWGVGQGVTAIGAGTYDVELSLVVPVAEDMATLMGAVFAQTTATSLDLNIDWAAQSDLFVLTGNATVAMTLSVVAEPILFSIPSDGRGGIWLPNLSAFHSLVENRVPGVGNNANEHILVGQGVGKQLERVFWRVFNGSPGVPLAVNATNFTNVHWAYGSNDVPETYVDGLQNRYVNERLFNTDFGVQGFNIIDFAKEWAFRDTIDEGAATDLRIGYSIPSGVSLTSPAIEIVQETIFAGAAGA